MLSEYHIINTTGWIVFLHMCEGNRCEAGNNKLTVVSSIWINNVPYLHVYVHWFVLRKTVYHALCLCCQLEIENSVSFLITTMKLWSSKLSSVLKIMICDTFVRRQFFVCWKSVETRAYCENYIELWPIYDTFLIYPYNIYIYKTLLSPYTNIHYEQYTQNFV